MLRQSRRDERDLRIQQITERTALPPDDFVEEGQRFLSHVGGEPRVPVRKLFRIGPQIVEPVEVQPFGNELPRAFDGAGILQHPSGLRFDSRAIERPVFCGLQQRVIGRTAPQDVAQSRCQFVGGDRSR